MEKNFCMFFLVFVGCITPLPLYNTIRFDTGLDITWVIFGLQMAIKD